MTKQSIILLLRRRSIELDHRGDEPADMVVGEAIELVLAEHVRQEAEYLHVDELNVYCLLCVLIRRPLLIYKTHYAFGNPHVPCLLRFVLESEHFCRNFILDLHIALLIHIKVILVTLRICMTDSRAW